MKCLVASDIHGSLFYAKKVMEAFEYHQADLLVLLGDYLYHGPRNPLPTDYNPMEVAQLLNAYQSKIVAVRGNCDSEVDQMVINFDISSGQTTIILGKHRILVTHGHLFPIEKVNELEKGSIMLFGHIHLPIAKKENDCYILNPGSISLPKENNPHSYGLLTEEGFTIFSDSHDMIKSVNFN